MLRGKFLLLMFFCTMSSFAERVPVADLGESAIKKLQKNFAAESQDWVVWTGSGFDWLKDGKIYYVEEMNDKASVFVGNGGQSLLLSADEKATSDLLPFLNKFAPLSYWLNSPIRFAENFNALAGDSFNRIGSANFRKYVNGPWSFSPNGNWVWEREGGISKHKFEEYCQEPLLVRSKFGWRLQYFLFKKDGAISQVTLYGSEHPMKISRMGESIVEKAGSFRFADEG